MVGNRPCKCGGILYEEFERQYEDVVWGEQMVIISNQAIKLIELKTKHRDTSEMRLWGIKETLDGKGSAIPNILHIPGSNEALLLTDYDKNVSVRES